MHVRPLTRADIPAVAQVALAAFSKDELYQFLYPKLSTYPDDFRRAQVLHLRARLVQPGCHGYVAVSDSNDDGWDGTSHVLGYAFFQEMGERVNETTGKKESLRPSTDSWGKWFERGLLGFEVALHNRQDRALDRKNVEQYAMEAASAYPSYLDMAAYWYISVLAVHPQHQRRGVGTKLVREGKRLASEDGVALTLESSVAARRLYEKNGFRITWKGQVCGMEDSAMMWKSSLKAPRKRSIKGHESK